MFSCLIVLFIVQLEWPQKLISILCVYYESSSYFVFVCLLCFVCIVCRLFIIIWYKHAVCATLQLLKMKSNEFYKTTQLYKRAVTGTLKLLKTISNEFYNTVQLPCVTVLFCLYIYIKAVSGTVKLLKTNSNEFLQYNTIV